MTESREIAAATVRSVAKAVEDAGESLRSKDRSLEVDDDDDDEALETSLKKAR